MIVVIRVRHQHVHVAPDDLVAAEPEHVLGSLVEHDDRAGLVDLDETVQHRLDHRHEAILQLVLLCQRCAQIGEYPLLALLRLFPLGDVATDGKAFLEAWVEVDRPLEPAVRPVAVPVAVLEGRDRPATRLEHVLEIERLLVVVRMDEVHVRPADDVLDGMPENACERRVDLVEVAVGATHDDVAGQADVTGERTQRPRAAVHEPADDRSRNDVVQPS